MIKPTVGRVVWFYRRDHQDEQPLAAIDRPSGEGTRKEGFMNRRSFFGKLAGALLAVLAVPKAVLAKPAVVTPPKEDISLRLAIARAEAGGKPYTVWGFNLPDATRGQ